MIVLILSQLSLFQCWERMYITPPWICDERCQWHNFRWDHIALVKTTVFHPCRSSKLRQSFGRHVSQSQAKTDEKKKQFTEHLRNIIYTVLEVYLKFLSSCVKYHSSNYHCYLSYKHISGLVNNSCNQAYLWHRKIITILRLSSTGFLIM